MNLTTKAKRVEVTKREVFEAWKKVKANRGAAGIDGKSLEEFERKLSRNLYKLWNRMLSGSYFPQAVKRVEIPKKDGGTRPLGIPTVYDRVAQEVVRARLEPILEPLFHKDSYGYRRGRSAINAIATCRKRNWRHDWVLDVDIQKFFDTLNHALLLKAVNKHVNERWMVLYIERWLKAPIKNEDGTELPNNQGTPQGGVISPILANLYLHYTFDAWMCREHPAMPFERYADDIVVHCESKAGAQELQRQLEQRFAQCHLTLHPTKTQIVYCKDSNRKENYPKVCFTFLGFTFRPRAAKSQGEGIFTSFLPAVSLAAETHFRQKIREKNLARLTLLTLPKLAYALNPMIRGWFQYFAHFHRSALHRTCRYLEKRLTQWIRRKYRIPTRASIKFLTATRLRQPKLFAHWEYFEVSTGRAV